MRIWSAIAKLGEQRSDHIADSLKRLSETGENSELVRFDTYLKE